MKKLILTAAIVCAAVATQAATANWKVTAANIFDGTGTTAKYAGSAYFFDAKSISQSALFALFDADNGLDLSAQTGYLSSGTVANGVINANTAANQFGAFEQASGYQDFFFALVDEDRIFLSDVKSVQASGTDDAVQISFGAQTAGSKLTTAGYTGVGQWAQSVPEPTSGLLLLMGVAGLALKRKRA